LLLLLRAAAVAVAAVAVAVLLLLLLLDGLHHSGRRSMRVVLHNGLLFLFTI